MSGRATPMARAPDAGPGEQTPSVRRYTAMMTGGLERFATASGT